MSLIDLGVTVGALLALVAAGTVVHEYLHALTLRTFGIPYTIEWVSGRDGGLRSWLSVRWASVTPDSVPPDAAAWQLRLAAIAPLSLAVPFVLVGTGIIPAPFARGPGALELAAVALLATAIPSPDDFSLFWYADRILNQRADAEENREYGKSPAPLD
jgi:hypothetical protein